MIVALGCLLISNTLFLEQYYINDKQNNILEAYVTINDASNEGTLLSDEFDVQLEKLGDRYNLNILVVNVDSNVIKSVGNDAERTMLQLWNHLFLTSGTEEDYIINEEQYKMKIVVDDKTGTENIEMWGVLDNSNLFLIRTPIESIQDSVSIANQFLGYLGIVVILGSALIIWMITRKITEPISELTNISEKMAHLDFETKYNGNSQNEIGILGDNFNSMSMALEQTISELKTANAKLMKDIQKKDKLDQMRTEFLSNVSHELKTPISLIQGYAEGLIDGIYEDDENKNFYCSVIVDEADKMNTMVKKLLSLNQLEFGSDEITMERFDIVELVNNYIQSANIMIVQNNCRIQIEESNPVFVWGDEFKVEEVFMNYFTNAMNHVSGERIIDVKFQIKENRIRVTVFNTGDSIPEESIAQVWEKFYKVDKARTREYGGSGIGLSIVKAIMESMNQKYGVDNYTNGVAFWFELELVL